MKTMSDVEGKVESRLAVRRGIARILLTVIFAGSAYGGAESSSVKILDEKTLNSCGPLSLQTALSLLGRSVDVSQCAKLAGTDPNGTTTLAGLQAAAAALGESATGMHLKPEELAFIKRPAILHVSTPGIDDHYVVLISMTGPYFNVIDPLRDNVEGYLHVYPNPPPTIGPFQYSLLVPSNDPQGPQVLTAEGRVTGAGSVAYPPRLYFDRVRSAQTRRTLSCIIRRPGIEIVDVTSDLPLMKCTYTQPTAASSAFLIDVSLQELPNSGPFEGTIKIITNDPEPQYAAITVPFSGIVEPED